MRTTSLAAQKSKLERQRSRLEFRLSFYRRFIEDVDNDFHKLYGPSEQFWSATREECVVYGGEVDKFLLDRDLDLLECRYILTAIEDAPTAYRVKQLQNNLEEFLTVIICNDISFLEEQDENISRIRSVYRMISNQEELEG